MPREKPGVGEVLHLFEALAHGQPMREADEVTAVVNKGFEHCIHGRLGGSRQVLLMDIETLGEFGIAPGRVKENVTTRGLDLKGLSLGRRLSAGEAILEVARPCEPCHLMDEIRMGYREAMRGRRGVLCRVIQGGRIRRGDRIEIQDQESGSAAGKAHGQGQEAIE